MTRLVSWSAAVLLMVACKEQSPPAPAPSPAPAASAPSPAPAPAPAVAPAPVEAPPVAAAPAADPGPAPGTTRHAFKTLPVTVDLPKGEEASEDVSEKGESYATIGKVQIWPHYGDCVLADAKKTLGKKTTIGKEEATANGYVLAYVSGDDAGKMATNEVRVCIKGEGTPELSAVECRTDGSLTGPGDKALAICSSMRWVAPAK